MAWLRIDDGFAQHPKITALNPKQRWTWLEILSYCARYRTEGVVPSSIGATVRGASSAYLKRCLELTLLDEENGVLMIHDWHDYNGSDPKVAIRDRVRKHRERNADVTAEVTARNAEEPLQNRSSRVGARARSRPVPNPIEPSVSPSALRDPGGRTDDLRIGPAAKALLDRLQGHA